MLFFSGNRVLAFLGLLRLLGALYLSDELLQLSQQALVGDTERLHLVRVELSTSPGWSCILGGLAL